MAEAADLLAAGKAEALPGGGQAEDRVARSWEFRVILQMPEVAAVAMEAEAGDVISEHPTAAAVEVEVEVAAAGVRAVAEEVAGVKHSTND